MELAAIYKLSFLALFVMLLVACSTDPNKQKLKYLNSGERYFKEGKYREAVIQFRNAIQIDPRFAEAHCQLARAYMSLGKSEPAYRELIETTTLDPMNADAQLQLASLLIARRQYEQASAAANKVLAADPRNARAHAILGERYVVTHDLQNAMSEIQKALELDAHRVEDYGVLGAIYLSAGQKSESEAAYRRAVEVNPESVQARVALGQFYFSQRRLSEAEAEIRVASALDLHAVLPRLFLTRIYIATGKMSDAEGICRELKTIAPDNPQAYQALGLFYESTDQKLKAATEFQSLLESKPKDGSVKAHLVEVLMNLNRIKEAQTLNQEMLSSNPADPRGLSANGRILVAEGKYQQAIDGLQKAIRSEPKYAANYYFLGVAHKSLGLLDLAKSSFTHALELAPQNPQAAVALADLSVKSGDFDGALRLAGGALETDPNSSAAYAASAQAWLAKGDVRRGGGLIEDALKHDPASLPALAMLLKLDKPREAVQRISTLVVSDPQNARLHLLLGLGYFSLKELDRSEASVSQAIKLDPGTPDAYTLLANIHFARGSVEMAKMDLRTAIDSNPRNATNYIALYTQYEKEGNWEEAKKFCEKAHEVDPANALVTNELAYLYLEHGGDVNVALSLAQVAKQKMPNSPSAADALGWAYYKIGAPQSAVVQLKECVLKIPNNPIYQYHLGMAYAAARHFDSAEQSLQRALRNDPSFPYAASARATLNNLSGSVATRSKRKGM